MLNKDNFITFIKRMNVNVNENEDYIEIHGDTIAITLNSDYISDYQSTYNLIKEHEEEYYTEQKAKKQLQRFKDNVSILLASDEFGQFLKQAEIRFTDTLINKTLKLAEKMKKFDSNQIYKIASLIASHSSIELTPFDLSQLK